MTDTVKPGGWVDGIGWVAGAHTLPDGAWFKYHAKEHNNLRKKADKWWRTNWTNRPVVVVEWPDGSTPEPPKRLPDVTELPEWQKVKRLSRGWSPDRDLDRAVTALVAAVDSRGEKEV